MFQTKNLVVSVVLKYFRIKLGHYLELFSIILKKTLVFVRIN